MTDDEAENQSDHEKLANEINKAPDMETVRKLMKGQKLHPDVRMLLAESHLGWVDEIERDMDEPQQAQLPEDDTEANGDPVTPSTVNTDQFNQGTTGHVDPGLMSPDRIKKHREQEPAEGDTPTPEDSKP